jgi:hypothetical protein
MAEPERLVHGGEAKFTTEQFDALGSAQDFARSGVAFNAAPTLMVTRYRKRLYGKIYVRPR